MHEHEADGDPRRDADRARHGDVERRVLVAVADLRAQNLARRRQADRRLLVEQPVDVTRQPLGPAAVACCAAHRLLGLGANLRRIAFDQRLRRRDTRASRIAARPGCEHPRIRELDHVAVGRWPRHQIAADSRRPSRRSFKRRTSRGSSIRSWSAARPLPPGEGPPGFDSTRQAPARARGAHGR